MDCSLEECSVDSSEPESEIESSTSSELATENQAQDGYACGAVDYDESLELVANEEEALQYRERLQVETEEEEKLQCRFSGEQPVQEWWVALYIAFKNCPQLGWLWYRLQYIPSAHLWIL